MKCQLLIFINLLFYCQVFSQVLDMRFIEFPANNQLSSSFATCIEQDSQGYIWIGTTNGLNRYNGYEIEIYKKRPNDSTSLLNNDISCLYCDKKGRLWVGSTLGLCLYNSDYNSFTRVLHEKNAGIENIAITHIGENPNGHIYASSGDIIYKYDESGQTWEKVIQIANTEIHSFVFTQIGNIWIASAKNGGLFFHDINSNIIEKFRNNPNDKNSLSNNNLFDLALAGNHLWIVTGGGGINRYNIENKTFKRYPTTGSYDANVHYIYIDNDSNIWACGMTGLKFLNKKDDTFYCYYPNKKNKYSIKPSVRLIFQDIEGIYWTLHTPGGVGLRLLPKGFFGYNSDQVNYWHTSNDNISAIIEDAKGNPWFANPFNGIDIFNWRQGKIITYQQDPTDKFSLGSGAIFSLLKDSRDVIWIGSNMGGLQYFDETNQKFISYVNNPDNISTIGNNDVRSIAEDKNGNLWIATHGKGIDKFDRQRQIFHHYNKEINKLSNNWVNQVIIDQDQTVWVGTFWGLSSLKFGEDTFEVYLYNENDSNSLVNNLVRCLYVDSKNQLWTGTNEGLNLFNTEKKTFTDYSNGLPNLSIRAILEDNNYNIWVSTLKGLSRINPEKKTFRNFNHTDGLLSDEFNPTACYKNNEGTLFFGSIKGVNFFNPEKIIYNTYLPKVTISHFMLFNKEVTPSDSTKILEKNISRTKEIKLQYSQNMFTVKYTAVSMLHAEKIQHAYCLEGFDNKWHYVEQKREATYTNLDPGEYTFRVKAANNDGFWSNKEATLKIIVSPPWWLALWFKILGVFIVTGLFALFYFIRIRQLNRQKIKLEEIIKKRTDELQNKNALLIKQTDDLNNVNTLLEERQQKIEKQTEELRSQSENMQQTNDKLQQLNSTKDKLFSIIAHDLINPFSNILGFTDLLSNSYQELNDEDRQDIATNINISSKIIYELLENLLNWTRSQTHRIKYEPEDINITPVIQSNISIQQNVADNKNITIVYQPHEEIIVYADENMLKTIIRNLLSNAIKFTCDNGQITISTKKTVEFAEISISDTGVGIEETVLNELFIVEKITTHRGTKGEKGSGLGLLLCKEFIEKNGGQIKINSISGVGSTFSFTIPLSLPASNQKS